MAPHEGRAPWSWPTVGRAAVAASVCVASGWAVGYMISHERSPEQRRSSRPPASESRSGRQPQAVRMAGPSELALLAPLRPGSPLEEYTLESVEAVEDGTFGVVLARAETRVRLEVALASADAPQPPGIAGRFAVYYEAQGTPPGEGGRLAMALARAMAPNASAPVPPGLHALPTRRADGSGAAPQMPMDGPLPP